MDLMLRGSLPPGGVPRVRVRREVSQVENVTFAQFGSRER